MISKKQIKKGGKNKTAIKVIPDENRFDGQEVVHIKEFYDKPTSLKTFHNILQST